MAGCPFLAAKSRVAQWREQVVPKDETSAKGGHHGVPPGSRAASTIPLALDEKLGRDAQEPVQGPVAGGTGVGTEPGQLLVDAGDRNQEEVDRKSGGALGGVPKGQCPLGFSSSAPQLTVGKLECSLCLALLFQPSRCLPCTHVFCRYCLSPFLDCPACGADIEALSHDTDLQEAVDAFISAHILRQHPSAPGPPSAHHLSAASASTSESATTSSTHCTSTQQLANAEAVSSSTSAAPPPAAAAVADVDGAAVAGKQDGPTPAAAAAPALLQSPSSSPSSYLFLQALRVMKRGNWASARSRLGLCVQELKGEMKDVLLQLTHSPTTRAPALPQSEDPHRHVAVCPYASAAGKVKAGGSRGSAALAGGRGAEGQGIAMSVAEQAPEFGSSTNAAAVESPDLAVPEVGGLAAYELEVELGSLMKLLREQLSLKAGVAQEQVPDLGNAASLATGVATCPHVRAASGGAPVDKAGMERLLDVLTRLGTALGSLADCCAMAGDVEGAAACYREAIYCLEWGVQDGGKEEQSTSSEEFKLPFRIWPDSSLMELLKVLTVSLNKLGDLRFRLGQMSEALALYQKALAVRIQSLEFLWPKTKASAGLPDAGGEGHSTHSALADAVLGVCISMGKVADAQEELGQVEAAKNGFLRALQLAERPPSKETIQRLLHQNASTLAGFEAASGHNHSASEQCLGTAGDAPLPAKTTKRDEVIAMLRARAR